MTLLSGRKLYLVLAVVHLADALIPALPPCTSGILGVLVPALSAQAPAQSFCASKYPQTPVTTTATAPTVTSTVTTTDTAPTATETLTETTSITRTIPGLPTVGATVTNTETSTVTTTETTVTSTQTICSRDFGTFPNKKRNLGVDNQERDGGYKPPVYHTPTRTQYPTSTKRPPVYKTTTKSVSKYPTTSKTKQTYPTTTRKTSVSPTTTKQTTKATSTKTKGDVLTSLSSLKSSVLSTLCSCIATRSTSTTTITPSTVITTTSTITPIVAETTTITLTSTITSRPIFTTTTTTTITTTSTTTRGTVTRPIGTTFTETPSSGSTCGCQYRITCGQRNSGLEPIDRSFSPSNANQCARYCDSNPECVLANYAFNVGLCILFNETPGDVVNDPDFASIERLSDTCINVPLCS